MGVNRQLMARRTRVITDMNNGFFYGVLGIGETAQRERSKELSAKQMELETYSNSFSHWVLKCCERNDYCRTWVLHLTELRMATVLNMNGISKHIDIDLNE